MAELDQKQQQQAQFFWNAYSNIQAQVGPMGGYDYNRELLTYIQADQRYVSYTEAYADMRGITGTERERIVAEARETHQASSRTLDTSPGYSTDMQGLANDFYFTIEQSYPDTPAVARAETPAVAATTTTATTVTTDPATQRIDAAFAATEGATVAMPELEQYAARLRQETATPSADAVFTPMGDIAIPATPTAVAEVTPVATTVQPVTTAEAAMPVMTPMGDVAMPAAIETPAVAAETPAVATTTPAYDPNFTAQQLGSLGQTPTAGVTQTPTTTPIRAEDMPIPQPNVPVEQAAETPAAPAANTPYTVQRGDTLEMIARRHYNIERGNYETNADYRAAIQNAASHIASATDLVRHPNGKYYDLSQGANANHIFPGQTLQLPPAEALASAPESRLDYRALSAGGPIAYSSSTISPSFRAAAEGTTRETPAVAADLAGQPVLADQRRGMTASPV